MGTVNVADGSAQLSVHHAGGWSPLGSGGALADLLRTPAFDGTLAVGVGSALELEANATFSEARTLVAGLAELEAGATVSISLTQPTNASGGASSFVAKLLCGLKLGGRSPYAPPLLAVEGVLQSGGNSTLSVSTGEPWAPVPSLGGLSVPALNGNLIFDAANGLVDALVRHDSPIALEVPGGLLSMTNVFVNIPLSGVEVSNVSVGELPQLDVTFSGDVDVGGGGGLALYKWQSCHVLPLVEACIGHVLALPRCTALQSKYRFAGV